MDTLRYRLSQIDAAGLNHLDNDTFFASPGYATLWRTLGGRPVVWAVVDGERIVAALPGVEFGVGVLTRLQVMPDGTFARLRVASGIDRPAAARMLLSAIAEHGYFRVHVTDFDHVFNDNLMFTVRTRSTDLVDISDPAWQPPDKTLRGQIAQAARCGTTSEPFDRRRHMAAFLDLMHRTEKRHGQRARYPEEFFKGLAAVAARDNRVRWIWCEHEGRPAASHIFIVEGLQLLSWQTYFDKAYSFLKPNQHILAQEARRAAAEGITRLNLGASPPDAESLAAYKRHWGGVPHNYNVLVHKSWLGRLL